MICKDCLHYEACKGTYMNVSEYKSITDFDYALRFLELEST